MQMSFWNRLLFFTIVFAIVFGLQYLVYITFRNYLNNSFPEKLNLKTILKNCFLLFNLPYLYVLFNAITSNKTPDFILNTVYKPFYIFQSAVIFIGLYLLILKIIKLPFWAILFSLKKIFGRDSFDKFTGKKPVKTFNSTRRAFLKTSTMLVSGYAFTGAALGIIDNDDYEINKINVKLNNLPEELKGTTITLVSDIHSGPYMNENLMKEYADAINELNSDLILIPGDLTNSNVSEAMPFANAFKNLKAKNGIYASLGNHDFFSDPDYITNVVRNETPIKILRNEFDILNINGKELCIIGIDDTRQSGAKQDRLLMGNLDAVTSNVKLKFAEKNLRFDNIPKVTLFHKPYFFDEISNKNLDLILSGHTHGGQVVLAKFGDINISFAGAVSKYISGLYESGNSKMYVSKGIGSVALPIRLNCKPELTKITLI